METSLLYQKPVNRYFRKVSLDDWFQSLDYYNAGDNLKCLIHLLRYINGPVPIPDSNQLDLKIPHGSVYVYIKTEGENITVNVPFLKFNSSSQKLPAMRQMIEQNFSSLILGQIILKNDELWYHYSDKIANCEPYKIYFTLDEICNQADNNDDYYIDRFKLEHVENPHLETFTDEELQTSRKAFSDIINEGLQQAEIYEGKRWYNTCCDVLAVTFFRIRHSIFPQGILAREIQDALNAMYANEPVNNIIASTKNKLKKLLDYDPNKFKESLFHPKFLMPIKPRAEIPKIQEFLAPAYNRAKEGITNRAYADTGIYLTYSIYNLMDLYTIVPEIQIGLESTLQANAGKDWKVATDALYKVIGRIMEIQLDTDGNIVAGSVHIADGSDSGSSMQVVKSIFSKITNVFKKG